MAKNNASLKSVDEFLKRCQQSGDAAYSALRSVLERLEDPKTRTQARIFLSDLHKRFPTPHWSYTLGMIRFYCLQNQGSGASLMATLSSAGRSSLAFWGSMEFDSCQLSVR
ncbi:hypothetical protein ABKV19_012513 [Rosa sericea]